MPTHKTPSIIAIVCIVGVMYPALWVGAQKSQKPLEKQEVIDLLKGGAPGDHVEALAREHGIAFEMTAGTEAELREVGATDALVKSLRELALKAPGSSGTPTSDANAIVLLIEATPGGADVYVDGEPMGATSEAGRLKLSKLGQGKHQVRVSLKGYKDFEQSVELVPGETVIVKGTLEPAQPAAAEPVAAPPAATAVTNPSPTRLYVDYMHGSFGMTEGWLTIGNGVLRFSDPKGKDSFEISISDIKDVGEYVKMGSLHIVRIKVSGKGKQYDISSFGPMGRKGFGESWAQQALIERINQELAPKVVPNALPEGLRPTLPPATNEAPKTPRFRAARGHGLGGGDKGWLTISSGKVKFEADPGGESLEFPVEAVVEAKSYYNVCYVKLKDGKKYGFYILDSSDQNQPPDEAVAAIQKAMGAR
jgi:hypothetical protein